MNELQAKMGEATEAEAIAMAEILEHNGFSACDTADIPESKWLEMLNEASLRIPVHTGSTTISPTYTK